MTVRVSIVVAARSGISARVEAGEWIKITDIQGQQVGDFFAHNADDMGEFLSASHTRPELRRLTPAVGQAFLSSLRRPMVTLVADHSPGIHDMLIASCDPARYRSLGHVGWHASCAENFAAALARLGYHDVPISQPLNLFQDTRPNAEGEILFRDAATAPGDYVLLRAEMPLIVTLTACPQDITPLNGTNGPTDLLLEIGRD